MILLLKKKKDVPYLIDQHLLEKRMPKIIINGKEIEFEPGMTVLQACELAGCGRYQDFVITKDFQLLETVECV